ncbi:hypothetical protein [Sporolactobacillus sp. THM19-2]|nr:hypothetical protein [Sporolactobacillus sp. THM19-2]
MRKMILIACIISTLLFIQTTVATDNDDLPDSSSYEQLLLR